MVVGMESNRNPNIISSTVGHPASSLFSSSREEKKKQTSEIRLENRRLLTFPDGISDREHDGPREEQDEEEWSRVLQFHIFLKSGIVWWEGRTEGRNEWMGVE